MSAKHEKVSDDEIRAAILEAYAGATYRPPIAAVCGEIHTDPGRGLRILRQMIEAGEVPDLPNRSISPESRERRKAAVRRRAHLTSRYGGRAPAAPEPGPGPEPTPHQRLMAEHWARERRIGTDPIDK